MSLLAAGCGPKNEYFPLDVGDSWTFGVRTGYGSFSESIRATREISVGGHKGLELVSRGGTSRLYQDGGDLYLSEGAVGRFEPPIPLLSADEAESRRAWEGVVILRGAQRRAKGVWSQRFEKSPLPSFPSSHVLRSTFVFDLGTRHYELNSWFLAGEGLILQEQRANGELVTRLERVGTSPAN